MKQIKLYLTIFLIFIANHSFSLPFDSLYVNIQNDTLFVYDINEVNCMFSPIINYTIENNVIKIVEHDTSKKWTTCQNVKTFCIPITGLTEGHYIINIYYKYDCRNYDPDSLYFRGSIEVDFIINKIEPNTNKIMDYNLFNCYPNPFNSSLNINYRLNHLSNIEIDIFNELGQYIHQIEKSNKKEGDYHINCNFKSLQSGVYIIKLSSNKFCLTKKVTLIK